MPSIRRSDTLLLVSLMSFLALVLLSVDADPALAAKPECGAQPLKIGRVVELPQVGGLHHRYERRAA